MFHNLPILIVEDEPLIAMSLADEVEALGGRVVGPSSSVRQALSILATAEVAAAILDANLADRDVTPVALLLTQRGIPFVVHSAVGIPPDLSLAMPALAFVPKPAGASIVLRALWDKCKANGGSKWT